MQYAEISKTKSGIYGSLKSKKMRRRHGLFIVEGHKCVSDTLGAFDLECVLGTPQWLAAHARELGCGMDKIFSANEQIIKKISQLSTVPEVLAVFKLPETAAEVPELDKESLHLLLDGVQDPGNLGTIIRTADWFGFTKVYVSPDTVDIYNPKAVQATMGSLRRVKVISTPLVPLIDENGIENIYGTLLDGEDLYKADLSRPGVIVMGNEGNGLSEEIRKLVNRKLLIPPYRKEAHGESLNVAVATAITLSRFRHP